jgi:ATP-dependent DNA helicase DinG
MAMAIAEAVRTGEHLLVQAGTGTGKSLAYLVPALLAKPPVVVSTATLALQAQLVNHDLPRLAAAVKPILRRVPTFAVLKGRHHYLCLARLENGSADENPDALFDLGSGQPTRWLGEAGRLGSQIKRLRDWAMETETGDRDELDPGVDDSAWRQVSMPARECVGAARCPYGEDCFADASRVRAREADIVVTNHSLLAIDLLAGRHIIPEHQLLIVDEAHELAERVSAAAQAELTPDLVSLASRRTRSWLSATDSDLIAESAEALTAGLVTAQPGRLTDGLPSQLQQALTVLDAAARRAHSAVGEVKTDDPDPVRKQQARTALSELSTVTQRLLAEAEDDVAWVEHDDRGRRAVVVAPLSVADALARYLYADRTVVATSATLTLGGKFDTVARALGLPASAPAPSVVPGTRRADPVELPELTKAASNDESGEAYKELELSESDAELAADVAWRSLDVGSPFDYRKQGILYVAARLPRPTASGLSDEAAQELVALVTALGGRTLGLFSSRKAAERAAEVLRSQTDLPILLQGEQPLPLLVRDFRADSTSCLLGVASLWQGVDVPGDSCQMVVIDRLPFPRPDEPLAAARSAAVDATGGSGFAAVSVPIAAIRLAQGAGRLIRSQSDRGVVAVLDSRLETARGYGAFLRRSVPPFWYTTESAVVLAALRRLSGQPAS